MNNKTSKLEDSVAQLSKLIDKTYGAYIEKTASETGQPEMRSILKILFLKYLILEHAIKRAKDVDEFESQIEKAAELLARRIGEAQEKITYFSEIKKANLREQRAKLTQDFYSISLDSVGSLPEDETSEDYDVTEVRQIVKEADRAAKEAFGQFEQMFDGFEKFEDTLAFIDHHGLQSGLEKFRKWRKLRKVKQSLLRLLWNVVIFGWIFSLIVSGAIKLLSVHTLAFLALVSLSVALLKEYKVGPWLKQKRLTTQRADLLLSLRDFMIADLNFTILAPMKEKHRRKKTEAAVRMMTKEIEKEFSADS